MRAISPLPICLALAAGVGLGLGLRQDAPQTLAISGFAFEIDAAVPGTPEQVFDLFTGDISPWWDHHFVEKPAKLYIEPRPGGGFYELFDERGDGALHALVTIADRGKELVFRGALGFGKLGVHLDFVHRLTFEPEGDGTRIHLTVHGAGEVQQGWPQTVRQVWDHFLIEQFKTYAEKKLGN
jgi:uncharacterized protein YndB with AHSA1/START domain